jgi:hypothetical protein
MDKKSRGTAKESYREVQQRCMLAPWLHILLRRWHNIEVAWYGEDIEEVETFLPASAMPVPNGPRGAWNVIAPAIGHRNVICRHHMIVKAEWCDDQFWQRDSLVWCQQKGAFGLNVLNAAPLTVELDSQATRNLMLYLGGGYSERRMRSEEDTLSGNKLRGDALRKGWENSCWMSGDGNVALPSSELRKVPSMLASFIVACCPHHCLELGYESSISTSSLRLVFRAWYKGHANRMFCSFVSMEKWISYHLRRDVQMDLKRFD